MTEKSMGEMLSELVKDQLADERSIKNSLTQRATVLATGAGTVITLSLGAIGFFTRHNSFAIPGAALASISFALVALLAAGIFALVVNAPWGQRQVNIDSYSDNKIRADWCNEDKNTAIQIYKEYVELVKDLRRGNEKRSKLLCRIFVLELIAFLSLSLTVAIVLIAGMHIRLHF